MTVRRTASRRSASRPCRTGSQSREDYQWIVADADLLGGKLAVRGTRLSVAPILECLAAGMSLEDIDAAFDHAFPHEALPEVLKVASELAGSCHVAA